MLKGLAHVFLVRSIFFKGVTDTPGSIHRLYTTTRLFVVENHKVHVRYMHTICAWDIWEALFYTRGLQTSTKISWEMERRCQSIHIRITTVFMKGDSSSRPLTKAKHTIGRDMLSCKRIVLKLENNLPCSKFSFNKLLVGSV